MQYFGGINKDNSATSAYNNSKQDFDIKANDSSVEGENKVENSYLGKNKRLPNMDDQVAVRCTLPVVSNDNGTVSVCGADYRYACVGDGYAGGSGAACGKMYKSCQCASGYSWDGSHCARSCEVGYILNSDKTCTQNKVSGKTPIGVIACYVLFT